MSLWWSFLLTAGGVLGLFLTFRHPRSIVGPALAVALQGAWFAYAIATEQWWFLVSACAYAGVNLYGIGKRTGWRVKS